MPYYTYILESKKDKKLYIGSTNNLQIRLDKHNQGKVPSTSYRLPLTLIGYETYLTRTEALNREKQLKAWKNPQAIRAIFSGA